MGRVSAGIRALEGFFGCLGVHVCVSWPSPNGACVCTFPAMCAVGGGRGGSEAHGVCVEVLGPAWGGMCVVWGRVGVCVRVGMCVCACVADCRCALHCACVCACDHNATVFDVCC